MARQWLQARRLGVPKESFRPGTILSFDGPTWASASGHFISKPGVRPKSDMDTLYIVVLGLIIIIGLGTILGSFFTVNTAQGGDRDPLWPLPPRGRSWPQLEDALYRFGRGHRDRVCASDQMTLTVETKTKDNVFVTIPISVQNHYPAGKSIRRLLQAFRSHRADQILRGTGDSGPRSGHDAR